MASDGKSRPSSKASETDPDQYQRFLEAARELGCDENADRLDEVVRRAAKLSPDRGGQTDKPKKGNKALEK